MKSFLLIVVILGLGMMVKAQNNNEEKAVRQANLNYVESFYNADTAKVHASVHPELAKRGYYKRNGQYQESKMTFRQMVNLATRWNKTAKLTAESPKEITIFEIKDKIAVAKLKAHWGTDYFHLANDNGTWKIYNVIWQD